MSSSLDSNLHPTPSPPSGEAPIPEPVWGPLVERVQRGDTTAMAELYQTFLRGIRYYLCRHLGPEDLDDKVHDSYLIVVQAIQRGEIRDPEKLLGFVRTVARRQVAAHIDNAIQSRREVADQEVGARIPSSASTPEQRLIREEQKELMQKVLRGISPRDREILTRFYLHEQSQEQICEEMGLTETQFRLLKSRAKARFGAMGKRRLTPLTAREAEKESSATETAIKDWLGKTFLRKVAASGH
jgi:RNA polymerase sigma-70 factor, ECF subfamily